MALVPFGREQEDRAASSIVKQAVEATGLVLQGARVIGPTVRAPQALAPAAVAALALGAGAIGALAIGRLRVRRASFEDVTITRLHIRELVIEHRTENL